MPLVVPQSTGSEKEEWENKLVGKTIHESESNETTFCVKDLPEQHRIIKPNSMVTKDFRVNRLNVHVNDDGVVSHVQYG